MQGTCIILEGWTFPSGLKVRTNTSSVFQMGGFWLQGLSSLPRIKQLFNQGILDLDQGSLFCAAFLCCCRFFSFLFFFFLVCERREGATSYRPRK